MHRSEEVSGDASDSSLTLASRIHRALRTNNYALARNLCRKNEHAAASSLLAANRIGWTALHFAAAAAGSMHLDEAVDELTVVAEDGEAANNNTNHVADNQNQLVAQNVDEFGFTTDVASSVEPGNHEQYDNVMGFLLDEEDRDIPDGGWWRWLLLKIVESTDNGNDPKVLSKLGHGSRISSLSEAVEETKFGVESNEQRQWNSSPFVRRTEAGMTPIDLFFSGYVRPLNWQRTEVHTSAMWLRRDMKSVCGEDGLISCENSDRLCIRTKQRIRAKMEEERLRQRMCKESSSSCLRNEAEGDVRAVPLESLASGLLDPVPWDDSILDNLVNFWFNMELLLMLTYHGTCNLDYLDSADSEWRVIHALAFTGCPPEVARLAVALYPEQVKERDEHCDLPLHVAVQSRLSSSLWKSSEDEARAVTDIEDLRGEVDVVTGQRPRGSVHAPSTAPIINTLIDAYPHGAACADGNGRLPLNLALISGRTWRTGVKDILEACPEALFGTRDLRTHLFPFMLAAIDHRDEAKIETDEEIRARQEATSNIGAMWRFLDADNKERIFQRVRYEMEMIHLDTIYCVLRAMPDAIRCATAQ